MQIPQRQWPQWVVGFFPPDQCYNKMMLQQTTLFENLLYAEVTLIQQIKVYTDYTNNCKSIYLEQWFLMKVIFACQEIFGNDKNIFVCHN